MQQSDQQSSIRRQRRCHPSQHDTQSGDLDTVLPDAHGVLAHDRVSAVKQPLGGKRKHQLAGAVETDPRQRIEHGFAELVALEHGAVGHLHKLRSQARFS